MAYTVLDYTNYKGDRKKRAVIPLKVRFESNNEYHGVSWILEAYDVNKRRVRSFDIKQIHNPEVLENIDFTK